MPNMAGTFPSHNTSMIDTHGPQHPPELPEKDMSLFHLTTSYGAIMLFQSPIVQYDTLKLKRSPMASHTSRDVSKANETS